jgi:hypothetical protein
MNGTISEPRSDLTVDAVSGGRNITPYAASKGGVLQVTKAFSNEWSVSFTPVDI